MQTATLIVFATNFSWLEPPGPRPVTGVRGVVGPPLPRLGIAEPAFHKSLVHDGFGNEGGVPEVLARGFVGEDLGRLDDVRNVLPRLDVGNAVFLVIDEFPARIRQGV